MSRIAKLNLQKEELLTLIDHLQLDLDHWRKKIEKVDIKKLEKSWRSPIFHVYGFEYDLKEDCSNVIIQIRKLGNIIDEKEN